MEGKYIEITGACEHNLKNVNIRIPRDKLVLITGLSGSGKSSLAFDTLFAEGQRRYVESLSSYARQFLGKISRPNVKYIHGIPPAIAIEQKVNTVNPRSTVGTTTEIYEYMKLLFARIGKTYSPVSGREVKKSSVKDIIDYVTGLNDGLKVSVLAPVNSGNGNSAPDILQVLLQQGYSKVMVNGKTEKIETLLDGKSKVNIKDVRILIDSVTTGSEGISSRLAEAAETAFFEGKGTCIVNIDNNGVIASETFSDKFEADGIIFEEQSPHLFNFNSPAGACQSCEGFGQTIGIDKDLVIPDKSLSVYDDAVACWRGESMSEWKNELIYNASRFGFPIHKPFYKLSEKHQELLWKGNTYFGGLNKFFNFLEDNLYKIQYRVMLSRYRGKTLCPECGGSRLRKESGYVRINGKPISDLSIQPVSELLHFFRNLTLSDYDLSVSERLISEITTRLDYLEKLGLGYLALNRSSNTLSGGEAQRINLSTALGSNLTGSLYILDEPSIGLHPVDNSRLLGILKHLRDIGNTVIVVEHDEEIIRSSDHIIDLGYGAGSDGGNVVYEGTFDGLKKSSNSLTGDYITGKQKIALPLNRRTWNSFVKFTGARENNLKNIDVTIPLNIFCVVTGVSGSGKSTLVKKIIYPALKKKFGYGLSEKTGSFDNFVINNHLLKDTELVDQNPISRSTRSNPVTYIKVYDDIRNLYASLQLSHINNFKPSHFSFNVEGGRCDECQGEGIIKIEMQFMADVSMICETCNGMRFKPEILDVEFNGKNIYDVLDMTVDDAVSFFGGFDGFYEKKIAEKLNVLQEVGLGYVKLGQSSSQLSGGELQRLKLAVFLGKINSPPSLFIFDEPTTGLHFHDINKLLKSMNALIEMGHSVLVIEHNPEVIKCADWIIDLGPAGGGKGGYIVFEGTPEEIVNCENSQTGKFLKKKIKAD